MCGIAGILSLDGGEAIQLPSVYRMTQAMIHRGPDDEGFLIIKRDSQAVALFGDDTPQNYALTTGIAFYPKQAVKNAFDTPSILALGHRRLSILDLSPHGHQPMSTVDRRYWIVFNGEIYNYQEIGQELVREGVILQGHSDTEILLQAYVRWGEQCLGRLNGDFAFAVWDNTKRTLFCARDRIGIKPFYYTTQNNQLIFASDIKTIIASGMYKPEPDPQGLYLAMAFGIAPRPLTAFKDVKALEQAHWMRIYPDGRIEKQRYWQIPVGTVQPDMRVEEAVELLEERLTTAIRRRLVADVPVGTFMSGGIDSTTISAIAARLHPGIKAFTLAYEDTSPEMDEVPQAMATARMHPMQHIVHRVDPTESLSDLGAWVEGYEEPFYSLAANHAISKLVADNGVTVVLNGLGGDELFAGYGYYQRIPIWQAIKPFAALGRHLGPYLGRPGLLISKLSSVTTPDRLHTALFAQNEDRDLHELFRPIALRGIDTIETLHAMYADNLHFDDAVEAFSYMDVMNCIGNHHVHRVDQFTMAHSVEGRFPFLDHEVVELAFHMPAHLKMHKGILKYILRKVAKRHIAPECLTMKKKGFGLPLEQWMQGPLKLLVCKSLESLKQRDMIVPETVERFYAEYQTGRRSASHIWHLVALELWFERFIDRAG